MSISIFRTIFGTDLSIHLDTVALIAAVLAEMNRALGQEDDGGAKLRALALCDELIPAEAQTAGASEEGMAKAG